MRGRPVLSGAGFLVGVFAPVALLALAAYATGRAALRSLAREGAAERLALATALGLVAVGQLAFLLGLAGDLAPLPFLATLVVLGLMFLGTARSLEPLAPLPRPAASLRERWRGLSASRRILLALAAVAAVGALAPYALPALYPPTAFDATLYHLPYAKAFVASGGMPFLPDLRFPIFPQLNEALFAVVLLFDGEVAAQLVQLLATLLTAMLLYAWGRRAWGPGAGWLAAALFLGNPIVAYLAGTAYIEPGLALFTTAALYAAERWREGEDRRWLALAGVFAGAAAAVKYLGLLAPAAVGLLVLARGLRRGGGRDLLRNSLWLTLGVLAVALPWYARILAHTGNPVFPFLPAVFGASPWAHDWYGSELAPELPRRLLAIVRLPWDLVLERRSLGGLPPYSPVYLAGLPLALAAARREPRLRWPLAATGVYLLAFLVLPLDARYLLPTLPAVSVAVAGAAARWLGGAEGKGTRLAVLAVACFLPGWLYAGYHLGRLGPLPLSPEARQRHLARHLPAYPALAHLNRTLGEGYAVYAFHAESLAYFARGRFQGDWNGPAGFDRVLAASPDGERLYQKLCELGADHLLVVAGKEPPLPRDAAFRRRFRPVYDDGAARVWRLADGGYRARDAPVISPR